MSDDQKQTEPAAKADTGVSSEDATKPQVTADPNAGKSKEVGGRDGLDPTRYGDWEKAGRCIDF